MRFHAGLRYYWIVRKGTTAGSTWQLSDLYQYSHYANGGGYWAEVPALGSDEMGNVYAAGCFPDSNGVAHWLVRQSPDEGASWSLVDDFQYAAGEKAYAGCLGSDALGYIYVGGWAMDLAGIEHWMVRKATP